VVCEGYEEFGKLVELDASGASDALDAFGAFAAVALIHQLALNIASFESQVVPLPAKDLPFLSSSALDGISRNLQSANISRS
jgi:hypothetical protein